MEPELTLPSIGDVVDGRYRVTRKLGEGGTSTIFEVRHAITDKRFALKWLAPELAQQTAAVELFVHEAKVCGQLEHPNTVQIYDVRQTGDSWYLLMELLEGESLETRLQRVQSFSARTACDILLPCMEALSVAHQRGIVHLDLKPSNIFLARVEGRDEEVPKLLDFGIAKLGYAKAVDSSTVSGTPLYMAPEQLMGHAADPRFDVYALGVVLYELVAGRPPYDSDDFDELVVKIFDSHPPPLDQIARAAAPFAELVSRAMAREAEDRFASIAEFARALRPWASQRQAHSSPDLLREPSEVAIPLDDADLAGAEPASTPVVTLAPPVRPPPPAAALEPFGDAPRAHRKRWVAVAAALSGVALSWYGLTRATRDANLTKPEAAALRVPPAAVVEVPARELPPPAAEPVHAVPREVPAAPSFVRRETSSRAPAKSAEPSPARAARRKLRASPANEVASAKRERVERQAASSVTAPPDVSVSRSDF